MSRPNPAVLPPEARERAWAALWQRLLQPLPADKPDREPSPDDEATAVDSAAM